MPHTITPSEDGDYILIKAFGEITRESSIAMMVDAGPLAKELGTRCFLTDVTEARNIENVLDNYKWANADVRATPEADRGACIALLVAPHDHSHDFVVTLARNAGMDMTLFRNREAAIKHMREGAKKFNEQNGLDS
jgi:hypothetical protein